MTVLLITSAQAATAARYDRWAAIGDADASLDPARRVADLPALLEAAFDAAAPDWLRLATDLRRTPSARLTHTAVCAANVSDFGVMLAWTRLVDGWAGEPITTLVLCDDPWMYRHLKDRAGVKAGPVPPRVGTEARLFLRGWLARGYAAMRFARSAVTLSRQGNAAAPDAAMLLVYGHPVSDAAGGDGYFGALMTRLPAVRRILHVDTPPARAHGLAGDGRTTSLHGWGSPLYALCLIAARWRPNAAQRRGEFGWLVRRAAALEGATAQSAAIAWQIHCQARWLHRAAPATVSWPWENHAWERAFVAEARAAGVRTIGYQHSVVGRQMLNYAVSDGPGDGALPERIVCTGRATRDQLAARGVPADRLAIGGALRFEGVAAPARDEAAPIFMALPSDRRLASEMVAAARGARGLGQEILVRDHPMTPHAFEPAEGLRRSPGALDSLKAVSAVVYAATTVGLQSVIAGLPTFRFQSGRAVAVNILPPGIEIPTVTAETLCTTLAARHDPPAVRASDIFAPADWDFWRAALMGNVT